MGHFITQNTAEPMGVKECPWVAQDTQLILKHWLAQGVEFLHHQISERNLEMCILGEGMGAAVSQGKIERHVLKVTKGNAATRARRCQDVCARQRRHQAIPERDEGSHR